MIQLFKYYWENSIKLQGGLIVIFKNFILYPFIIVIGIYFLKRYGLFNNISNSEGRKNLVNMLAIVSGFLLTGLTIILSNTNIKSNKIDEITEKYKSYIMEYGNGDIYIWLSKFKLSILLDIIILIGICIILSIFVTLLKSNGIILYIMLYFLSILFIGLLTTIKQILTYLSIVEFN